MTELGAISEKLQREDQLLKELNDALLILEVTALGRNSEFSFSERQILRSRQFVADFVKRLLCALKQGSSSLDLQPIIRRFRSGMKPVHDWIEDLEELERQIVRKGKLENSTVVVLEDILSLLDDQFTEDLRHLYTL